MKKLFLFLFPLALQAQPLTLNDPVMLDWPKLVNLCSTNWCDFTTHTRDTTLSNVVCGTMIEDPFNFPTLTVPNPYTNTGSNMRWIVSAKGYDIVSTAPTSGGFVSDGHEIIPFQCNWTYQNTSLNFTNAKVVGLTFTYHNKAAISPTPDERVIVLCNSPVVAEDKYEDAVKNWTIVNPRTNTFAFGSTFLGWSGSEGITNVQIIHTMPTAYTSEFYEVSSSSYDLYTTNDVDGLVFDQNLLNESLNSGAIWQSTNYLGYFSYTTNVYTGTGCSGDYCVPNFNQEQMAKTLLTCGVVTNLTPAYSGFNTEIGNLQTAWGIWNTNGGGNHYLTNFVLSSNHDGFTNNVSGGNTSWSYFVGGAYRWTISWNIIWKVRMSYLSIDNLLIATNTVCN